MSAVQIQSKVNGRLETKYDGAIDELFSFKESLELLSSGNTNFTGIKGSDSLKAKLEDISSRLQDFQHPDKITKEQKKRLLNAVKSLKFDIKSKMECLKSVQAIDSLETDCCKYSHNFDQCSVDIVSSEEVASDLSENISGFISPAAQNCISANRESWNWIKKLHECTSVHLNNAADYQQYFHELAICTPVLSSDLSRLHNSFELHHLRGDLKDAHKLLRELHDITVALRQWQSRTDDLWTRANGLAPVNLRTNPLKEGDSPLPARAMCNYRTSETNIRDQEQILIVDNLVNDEWKVKTCEGKQTTIPSAAILIPGPCHEAIQEAIKLKLKLLAVWTETLKKVGHRLICFLLLVFKSDYDDAKVKTMTSIDLEDRDQLKEIMNYLEQTLAVHWTDHEGFAALQERLLVVRMILDDKKNAVNYSSKHKSHNKLVIQGQVLEKLMQKYKELWCWWDAYKVGLESCQSPDMMLILEKWQELKFVKPSDFATYWKSRLSLSDHDRSLCGLRKLATPTSRDLGEPIDETDMKDALNDMLGLKVKGMQMASFGEDDGEEEGILESIDEDDLDRANSDTADGGKFGYASERKMADTEQLSSAAMEEKKTFTIRSIVDTSTGKDISLQEATDRGIMIPSEGMYYNVKKDERIPIPVAMNQGLIRVEFTSTKRTAEKKSSVGIITIKTIQEYIRPYKLISAKNTLTGENLKPDEVVKQKIINEAMGMYVDLATKTEYTITEAFEKNLVEIEYVNEDQEDISTSQMFAVRAVMDVARQTTLTFGEAVKQGIIDKISGTFKNTLTYEKIAMSDAIMKGFLKARPIEDASMIEIDPENEMTINA